MVEGGECRSQAPWALTGVIAAARPSAWAMVSAGRPLSLAAEAAAPKIVAL